MTQQEREIIEEEINRMIDFSNEEKRSIQDKYNMENSDKDTLKAMYNYERGMMRGLERALNMIRDLEEIKEDRRIAKRRRA